MSTSNVSNKNFTPKFKKGDRVKAKVGITLNEAIIAEDSFLNKSGHEVMKLKDCAGYFDCDLWEKL